MTLKPQHSFLRCVYRLPLLCTCLNFKSLPHVQGKLWHDEHDEFHTSLKSKPAARVPRRLPPGSPHTSMVTKFGINYHFWVRISPSVWRFSRLLLRTRVVAPDISMAHFTQWCRKSATLQHHFLDLRPLLSQYGSSSFTEIVVLTQDDHNSQCSVPIRPRQKTAAQFWGPGTRHLKTFHPSHAAKSPSRSDLLRDVTPLHEKTSVKLCVG